MGFRISCLAFSGKSKAQVLTAMRLTDTGSPDEANEGPMSVAEFPGDWTIIWFNRFDHPFTEDASLRLFSAGCTTIVLHVHEGIMFSTAQLYRDGAMIWSISHDSNSGLYNLEVDGELPPEFGGIREAQFEKQKAEPEGPMHVDHVFNIPVDTSKAICGFQYDRWRYDWGEPKFTQLEDRSAMQ